MRRAAAVLALILAALTIPPAHAAPEVEEFATGLATPVDLAFGPDGSLYFAELASGNVRAVKPDGSVSDVLAHVAASSGGNGGFTGLTADPEDVGVLYVYYSFEKSGAPNGKVNRVSKLELATGAETVLVDDLGWALMHDGGRLIVGADGLLYVTTGDNDLRSPSPDPASPLGKVLRMTTSGEPRGGNDGWHAMAYAKGFRNPFGITLAADGTIYVSDNGGDEEVNRLVQAADYGWPGCTGPCDGREGITKPVASWHEHFGPTGVAVAGRTLYLADFVNGRVRTVDLETGETGVLWEKKGSQLLDVEVGADGCLYIAGWSAIWRTPLSEQPCDLAAPPKPGPGANGTEPEPEAESVQTPGWRGVPAWPLAAVAALALAARRRR